MMSPALLLTKVADMPGYPTKKLVFGRPETRTKALIFLTSGRLCFDHRAQMWPQVAEDMMCRLLFAGLYVELTSRYAVAKGPPTLSKDDL